MSRKKQKKYGKKRIIATISFVMILVFVCVLLYVFSPTFKNLVNETLNFNQNGNNLSNNSTSNSSTKVIESPIAGDGDLLIHMVDVGQGDAIIIQFPNGENMIIDVGPDEEVKWDTDRTDNNLTKYIDSLNISTFNYLIATHQDEDHIGLIETIFYNYEVKYVYRPRVFYKSTNTKYPDNFTLGFNDGDPKEFASTATYYNFLTYLQEEGCSWEFFNKDSDFEFSFFDTNNNTHTCSFDFLTPTSPVNMISYSDPNDYSPIIMMTYAGKKIMLTGDAETEAEKEFVDYYKDSEIDFDVDVLKVGHHGSGTSTSQAFLDLIQPEVALISCGQGNTYDHPHKATMQRLKAMNVSVWRTDQHQNVVLTIKSDSSKPIEYYSSFIAEGGTYDVSNMYVSPQD